MTLPRGWAEITIGELGKWQGGGTPSKENPAFWTDGHIPWVSPKDMKRNLIDSAEDSITEGAIAASATNLIPAGAILLVTRSGILKHTLPVAETLKPVAINQDLKALSPHHGAISSFVRHAFQAMGQDILHDCAKAGTTVDSIDFERLKTRSFALPPLAEQRRIVTKLDALTARIARARAELDHVSVLVEHYRRAVLAAAFRGKLTAEWRRTHETELAIQPRKASEIRSKYASSGSFDPPYEIPNGWAWLRLPELGDLDRGKSRHRPRNDARLFGGPYPFVQTGEVRQAHRFLTTYSETYSEFGLAQSRLWPVGTVCITIAANIAETAILGIEACFPDSVVGFLADASRVDASYVEFFLRTAREELAAFAPATAQKNINLDTLANVRLPMPPMAEQVEIVRLIEATFIRADRLESEAARARALLDRLESSILAKAFRGELVPQDDNDKPASELLERIRAQRAAAPKKSRAARRSRANG